jgi:hypothetical protein
VTDPLLRNDRGVVLAACAFDWGGALPFAGAAVRTDPFLSGALATALSVTDPAESAAMRPSMVKARRPATASSNGRFHRQLT